jgi:hypothetical protein
VGAVDYSAETRLRLSQIRNRLEVAKSRGFGDVRSNAAKDVAFLLELVDHLVDPGPKKAPPSKGVVKTLSDVSKGKKTKGSKKPD